MLSLPLCWSDDNVSRISIQRCMVCMISLLFVAQPLAAQSKSVTTMGPYTWTNSCGQTIQITVTVDRKPPKYKGLYKWDYAIQNNSVWVDFVSLRGPVYLSLGISGADVFSPQGVPEIANLYGCIRRWERASSGPAGQARPATGGYTTTRTIRAGIPCPQSKWGRPCISASRPNRARLPACRRARQTPHPAVRRILARSHGKAFLRSEERR